MKVFSFTKKGTDKKINTDSMLFTSGSIISNPWIINGQDNYSHYIDNIDDISLALIADGLGDKFASELSTKIFNNDFFNALNLVGEQEIFYWISESFVRLELNASRESAIDKSTETAGASLAGVFYYPFAGFFVFNAGDSKVFSFKNNAVKQLTVDHTSNGVLENCACAGGGHYVSIQGGMRDKTTSYLITTNSFIELVEKKNLDINDTVNKVLSSKNSEEAIKILKQITGDFYENISFIGISI